MYIDTKRITLTRKLTKHTVKLGRIFHSTIQKSKVCPTCSVGEGVLGGEGEVLQLVDGCLVLLPHSQELLHRSLVVTNFST